MTARLSDAEIYEAVVRQGARLKDVAGEDGRSPPTIRLAVHREFRRLYPATYAKLVAMMSAPSGRETGYHHHADVPVPYLWHLRAYEWWRVIAKPETFYWEGLSGCNSPEDLMFKWKWVYCS